MKYSLNNWFNFRWYIVFKTNRFPGYDAALLVGSGLSSPALLLHLRYLPFVPPSTVHVLSIPRFFLISFNTLQTLL